MQVSVRNYICLDSLVIIAKAMSVCEWLCRLRLAMSSVTGYAKMSKSTLDDSHHNNHSRKHDDDANDDHDERLATSSGVAAHEFGANDSPETTQVMEPGRVLAPNNFIPSKMRCSKRSMWLHRYQLDNFQSQIFDSQRSRKRLGDTRGLQRVLHH